MPLVRIDTIEGRYDDAALATIGEVVAGALKAVGAPDGDRFQVFATHPPGRLLYGEDYLGIHRTDGFVAIQITMNAGRTLAQKKGLFVDIASGIRDRTGARPGDVFVNLIEVPKENWSFGDGEAQYADPG